MKANEININKSIRAISTYLVRYIQKEKGVTQDKALQFLMKTLTYEMLIDKESKLFCESKEYVLDMLKNEIQGNAVEWMKI